MKILKREKKFCPCCMTTHFVDTVKVKERIVSNRGIIITYPVVKEYCSISDSFLEDEEMFNQNCQSFRDAMKEYGL